MSLEQLRPRRIALIKPSALGDIMHSLPVLSALRERFPTSHITWVVNRLYEPLLKPHRDLDATLPFDRNITQRGLIDGILGGARFLRQLRGQRFDLAIDLQGLFRTGLMTWATGAKVRVGLASAREGATHFYSHVVNDDRVHAVDRYGCVAEALGAGRFEKRFALPVEPLAHAWAQQLLAPYPRPWLAVGVGSRWLTKRWPPEHFAALVRRMHDEFGGTALFVGAPDEADLARQATAHIAGPVVDVTGKTSLTQLAALIGSADVMVANDTGPLHLAVALGRPVVAPYTCTQVRKTGPFGQEARAIQTSIWCAGSLRKTCDRLECMAELTPDKLWPILQETLRTWHQRRCA